MEKQCGLSKFLLPFFFFFKLWLFFFLWCLYSLDQNNQPSERELLGQVLGGAGDLSVLECACEGLWGRDGGELDTGRPQRAAGDHGVRDNTRPWWGCTKRLPLYLECLHTVFCMPASCRALPGEHTLMKGSVPQEHTGNLYLTHTILSFVKGKAVSSSSFSNKTLVLVVKTPRSSTVSW